MITHPPPQIPMETPLRKRKNFNKIELLPKKQGLLGNTSSWLVLQSFHPPMAGFFLGKYLHASLSQSGHKKGAEAPLIICVCCLLFRIRI